MRRRDEAREKPLLFYGPISCGRGEPFVVRRNVRVADCVGQLRRADDDSRHCFDEKVELRSDFEGGFLQEWGYRWSDWNEPKRRFHLAAIGSLVKPADDLFQSFLFSPGLCRPGSVSSRQRKHRRENFFKRL